MDRLLEYPGWRFDLFAREVSPDVCLRCSRSECSELPSPFVLVGDQGQIRKLPNESHVHCKVKIDFAWTEEERLCELHRVTEIERHVN
jgi:hypothetical protein